MPLPTSDFRNPVCMEMKALRYPYGGLDGMGRGSTANHGDMGSVDSSDTYASCNTHPSHSQGDLTSDMVDPSCAMVDLILDSNLYVNPLDGQRSNDNSPLPRGIGGVKKSASGDTALRSLGASPMEEAFKGFGGPDRGSRGSLNDTPLPKHRKTRFQQGVKPRTRFGETSCDSQESLEGKRGQTKRPSFMPGRSLASATRLINQHLFGMHALNSSRTGKNGGSKSSLSVDSIDSRTSPTLEQHRRSKSILKKSESSGRNGRVSEDPETEKLISDNTSGASMSDNGGAGSPNKLPMASSTPPMQARQAMREAPEIPERPRSMGPKAYPKPVKFVGLVQHGPDQRRVKSPRLLLDDLLGAGTGSGSAMEEGSTHAQHSPTEESKLLLHKTRDLPPS